MLFINVIFVCLLYLAECGNRDPRHCEVCIKVLEKYIDFANSKGLNPYKESGFESLFKDLCRTLSDKEERFCYYMGGLDTSATSLLKHISRPMSFQKPIKSICQQDVSKVDQNVCELRYEVEIDLTKIDLDRLPLRELRQILEKWHEECIGCTEKSDFVNRIKELLPSKLKQKQEL
ncbi:hypothetical protein ACOME3_010234 [Neoechinorhynchus agilis]